MKNLGPVQTVQQCRPATPNIAIVLANNSQHCNSVGQQLLTLQLCWPTTLNIATVLANSVIQQLPTLQNCWLKTPNIVVCCWESLQGV